MSRVTAYFAILARQSMVRLRWYGATLAVGLIGLVWVGLWMALVPPPGLADPGPGGKLVMAALAGVATAALGTILWGWVKGKGQGQPARFDVGAQARWGNTWAELLASRLLDHRVWRMVTLLNIFGLMTVVLLPLAIAGAMAHARGWI